VINKSTLVINFSK